MQPSAGPPDDWPLPETKDLLYRNGHALVKERRNRGLDDDAIRADIARLAEKAGKPFGPDTTRGIEDALAGRPCTP